MELVEVSPVVLAALGVIVMLLMQVLKWVGVVKDENSDAVKRVVVGALAGIAVVGLNFTQFLTIDFSNPVQAILQILELALPLWGLAVGTYHLLWDYVSDAAKKIFRL